MTIDTSTRTLYVPILKAKAGESDAMARLSPTIRGMLMPMFDIPRPSSFSDRTLDDQIERASRDIARATTGEGPIYLDTYDIPLEARCSGGVHPVALSHAMCRDLGVLTIPVSGFDRDVAHLSAISEIEDLSDVGLCIRLEDQDIEEPEDLSELVLGRCEELGLLPNQVDVLIDHRSLLILEGLTVLTRTIEAVRQ